MEAAKHRIDKYLWCIRIFKTRSLATEACDKGWVKWNGTTVKPARNVKVGDVFEVKTKGRQWVVKATQLPDNRMAYAEAIQFYEDITPPEMLEQDKHKAESFHTGKRLSKIGRPTKRQRRDLDDLLNEE